LRRDRELDTDFRSVAIEHNTFFATWKCFVTCFRDVIATALYAAVKCAVSVSCLAHAVSSTNLLKLPSQNNSLTVTVDILEGKFQAARTSKITVEPNHSFANMKWKEEKFGQANYPSATPTTKAVIQGIAECPAKID